MLSAIGAAVPPPVFQPPARVPFTSAGKCGEGCGSDAELQQLRAQDARIRDALRASAIAAGAAQATITSNVTYTIGADGQLYASGATVTSSRRVEGAAATAVAGTPLAQRGDAAGVKSPESGESGDRQYDTATGGFNHSLADLQGIRLDLSPLEFAQTFAEEFNDDLTRAKLQTADAGVRSHENLHFRAAGGLGSPPQFELEASPDGELFAVGGSVDISAAATTDPDKAARDAATVARAGLAPGDASAQDGSVARSAFASAAAAFQRTQAAQEPQAINIAA